MRPTDLVHHNLDGPRRNPSLQFHLQFEDRIANPAELERYVATILGTPQLNL